MTLSRRGFLHGILATAMAPAIVRSESLMKIVVPSQEIWTPSLITRGSFLIPHELAQKSFAAMITRLMPNGDAPLFNLQRGIYLPREEE